MKKIKIFSLLAICLLAMSFQQPGRLQRVKVTDGISVKLPENFTLVPEEALSERYISTRQPIALYTSPNGQAEFVINVSNNQWQHFDLPLVKDFYKASLGGLYSDIDFMKEETTETDKMPAAVFEYIGSGQSEEGVIRKSEGFSKYTYIAYVLVEGKVAIFSFTAPAKEKTIWAPVAAEIMESLKLKKTL
ncbi:hypothetical protein [Nafulsella turpanensis]|uniref:hypothetical protein n=1 Tax=Nafulsella turpanensis TaxID=1265690 RepID=UPI000344FC8E|nr:hypothetical protein [Nafulsella turpanensis]